MKYTININWSEEDTCYIAKAPAFPTLTTDGETMEEALADMQAVLSMAVDSLTEIGHPLPIEDRAMTELRRYSPVLNISALARRAGLNKHTLSTKLKRGTAFSASESKKIEQALTFH
jgi:predicted RNase H-like HicB family nuclease